MRQSHGWGRLGRVGLLLLALLGISARPGVVPAGAPYLTYLPLASLDNWNYVVNEDFEGQWPNAGWTLTNTNSNYFWGRRDCRPANGRYSAWLMGAGPLGANLGCGAEYQRGMHSWMRYGPFSLTGAEAAEFTMLLWFFGGQDDTVAQMVSTDGTNFAGSGYYGSGDGFFPVRLNLTGYAAFPQVWIAAYFYSPQEAGDSRPEGAYVDDLKVRYCVDNCPSTAAASVSGPYTVAPVTATFPEPIALPAP